MKIRIQKDRRENGRKQEILFYKSKKLGKSVDTSWHVGYNTTRSTPEEWGVDHVWTKFIIEVQIGG